MQAILNKASKYIKELNALTLNEYNPIEVFYRMTREKELAHSEILAELLSPDINHCFGARFAQLFFRVCGVSFPLDGYQVIKEKTVSRVLTTGGQRRIDIFISWNVGVEKHCIIIENKLNDAEYQFLQLEEYEASVVIMEHYCVDKIVCLTRLKEDCSQKLFSISATELADMIDSSNIHNECNIKSYSYLLKNIAMMDLKVEKFKSLLEEKGAADTVLSLYKLYDEAVEPYIFGKIDSWVKNNISRAYSSKGCIYLENEENGIFICILLNNKTEYWLEIKSKKPIFDENLYSRLKANNYTFYKEWFIQDSYSLRSTRAFEFLTDKGLNEMGDYIKNDILPQISTII